MFEIVKGKLKKNPFTISFIVNGFKTIPNF